MSEGTSSSSSAASPPAAPSPARGPWLFHPVVDVLVGCGLLAAPLALVSDVAAGVFGSTVLVVFGALSVVVNGPHYAATVVRAWSLSARHRRILVVVTVAALVAIVVAHVQPALLPWLVTAYLTWSPWHYVTQNHGIGLVLLARDGGPNSAAPTTTERRGLKLAHIAFAAAAIVATHAGPRDPLVVRVGVPADVAVGVAVAAVVFGVVVAGVVLSRLRKRGASRRGLLLLVALLSTSLVWFVVPALLSRGNGALLYASGVVALLHCAQYLWITSFVEGRSAFVAGRSFDAFAWSGLVVGVGVLLFTAIPWIASKGLGYDLVISLLIVQAVANLHHFIVDATVWKLRDPAVRAPIFSGHERAKANRHTVSNARALAWSLPAIALFLLGILDVIQLAGTRADAHPELALRAMVLNDNDSRVWVQSAQDAIGANDLDAAKADLARAVALSPYNADAQRALARLHVAAGRDDEAWSRFQAMPDGVAADTDARLLFGAVALRLEKYDDALALGRAALKDLDGGGTLGEVEARRVIGTALVALKQPGDGRTELKRALDDAQEALGYDPLARGQLTDLGLALADADVALNQIDPALALYDRCLDGAAKANNAAFAFRALTAQARVYDARNKPQEALSNWQRALRFVDEVKGEPALVAQAWIDYAALLARSDAPMRVRYACALKARTAAEQMAPGAKKDERLHFITEATRYVEEVLSKDDIEAVRKDPAAAAKDALSLSYPDPADTEEPAVPPALTP